MRRTYRMIDHKLVEVTRGAPAVRVHVIGDEIAEPFRGLGKWQTSKSAWRRNVRERGCEEVGNERQEFEPQTLPELDIRQELADRIYGRMPEGGNG